MMTRQETAFYALEALKKAGAGKAACTVSTGRKDEFNVEANKFSLLRTLFNNVLSVKAIKDGRKGVIAINKLDKDSVDEAVANCVAMTASALPDDAEDIAEKGENKSFDQTIGQTCGDQNMDKLFSRTKEFVDQIGSEFPKIVLESLVSDFNSGETTYVNSNGVEFNSSSESYDIQTMFSAKDGGKSSSFNGYFARIASLDTPFMELDMHRQLLDESSKSLNPRMVDGKFVGKVLLTPACYDMLWYALLENFLSDAPLVKGTSRWKDALGTKVADSKLTLRTVPLDPLVVAGERFTVDGFESRDMDIIREGVLENFALTLYGSRKTGKPRALNSAFSNIEVAAGDKPLEEIIRGIDRGILMNRFSGGSSGASGEMSGVAKNSFLIENGKVTDALKETMVSFDIVNVLSNITAISSERCRNGVCILPWSCFDGVTISGK
jgi:PmbA protein